MTNDLTGGNSNINGIPNSRDINIGECDSCLERITGSYYKNASLIGVGKPPFVSDPQRPMAIIYQCQDCSQKYWIHSSEQLAKRVIEEAEIKTNF
ncbi:MAG: hypothetical protein Q7S56_02170 [Nanoarchaeota archaeon]|nr:hypothetical protein [Nanoarchaeota archaeon]